MIRWLLRKLGYISIDHGCSCGRHYLVLDGKVIVQTPGDDVWLDDESVVAIGKALGFWKDTQFYGWRGERASHNTRDAQSRP